MQSTRVHLLVVSASLFAAVNLLGAGWQGWTTDKPETEGFSSDGLETLWNSLQTRGTAAFLLIRNDRIIFERYSEGAGRDKPHYTASMAKALVGGVSLMLGMDEGRVRPEDLASRYVPEWNSDPMKGKITVAQLSTHTSGIEDAEEGNTPHNQLTGWKGDFWKQLPPPRDPFTLAREIAPVLDPPGTQARYSNPGMAMLSYCLTAALRGSTNSDLRAWLRNRVMEPIGVPAAEWSVGYGKSVKVGDLALVASWGGAAYSPNATARVGRLLLHGGNWYGKQLISRKVVEEATRCAGLPNHSGLGWWVNRNADGSLFWPDLPGDAFYGAGAGHQFLLVVPSRNLIVVRNGGILDSKMSFDDALAQHLVKPLIGCLRQPNIPRGARPLRKSDGP